MDSLPLGKLTRHRSAYETPSLLARSPLTSTGFMLSIMDLPDRLCRRDEAMAVRPAAKLAREDLASLAEQWIRGRTLASEALAMSDAVRRAVERYSRTYDFRYGWMYARRKSTAADAGR
jgi:hypothetical protein